MMSSILKSQLPSFTTLAEAWLAAGAAAFGIWSDNSVLACWPPNGDLSASTLAAEIQVDSVQVGELRVTGLATNDAQARLETDARLISYILPLERDVDSVAAELLDTRDRLVAIYELTQSTHSCGDGNQILEQLAGEAARLLKAKNAFLLVDVPEGDHLFASYSSEPILSERIIKKCLGKMNGERCQYTKSGNKDKKNSDINNFLIVPMRVCSARYSALGFINTVENELLSSDLKLANTIADYAGAQIENLLMNRANVELAKLQVEMELAQRVQLRLLPKAIPSIPGIDHWAISQPASQVGGDFYDFITKKGQPTTFIVGDVSGKGMSAALLMTMTRTVIRTEMNTAAVTTPELIINWTNSALYEDYTEQSMFATLFVGQYDSAERMLTYANAGHSPVIYYQAGREARLLEADGPAIGILPEGQSRDQSLQFCPGDLLVIGTDGLNEASNLKGSLYGYSRLLQNIEALAEKPARAVAEGLYHTVKDFSAGRLQEDDQTLIVIKCVG